MICALHLLLSLSALIRDLFFSSVDQRLGALVCAEKSPLGGGDLLCCLFVTHLCHYTSLYVSGYAVFIISALWMLQREATFMVKCNAFLFLMPLSLQTRPGHNTSTVAPVPWLIWCLSMYLCAWHSLVLKQHQEHNQEEKKTATDDRAFSANPSAASFIDTISRTPRINKV